MTQEKGIPYQRHKPSAALREFLDPLDPGSYFDCGQARLHGLDDALLREAESRGRRIGDDSFQLVATDMGLIYCRPSISFAIAARWDEVMLIRPNGDDPVVLPVTWPTHGELKFTVSKRLAGNIFRRWLQLRVQAERLARREKAERFGRLENGARRSGEWEVIDEVVAPVAVDRRRDEPAPKPDRRRSERAVRKAGSPPLPRSARRRAAAGHRSIDLREPAPRDAVPRTATGGTRTPAPPVEEGPTGEGGPPPAAAELDSETVPPSLPRRPASTTRPVDRTAGESEPGPEAGSGSGSGPPPSAVDGPATIAEQPGAEAAELGVWATGSGVDPPTAIDQPTDADPTAEPEPPVEPEPRPDVERNADPPDRAGARDRPAAAGGAKIRLDEVKVGDAAALVEPIASSLAEVAVSVVAENERGGIDNEGGDGEPGGTSGRAGNGETDGAIGRAGGARSRRAADHATWPSAAGAALAGSDLVGSDSAASDLAAPDLVGSGLAIDLVGSDLAVDLVGSDLAVDPTATDDLTRVIDIADLETSVPDLHTAAPEAEPGDRSAIDPAGSPADGPPIVDQAGLRVVGRPVAVEPSWVGSAGSLVGAMVLISTFVLLTTLAVASYRGSIDIGSGSDPAGPAADGATPRTTIDHRRFRSTESIGSVTVQSVTVAQPEPPTSFSSTTAATVAQGPRLCNSNYSGCVPDASDVDCPGDGDGPVYAVEPAIVMGEDIYQLDTDRDGQICEPDQPRLDDVEGPSITGGEG